MVNQSYFKNKNSKLVLFSIKISRILNKFEENNCLVFTKGTATHEGSNIVLEDMWIVATDAAASTT